MNWKRQIPTLILLLFPFIYLLSLYGGLPEQVPTHWNISGEADSWSHKTSLWWILLLINGLPLLIFLLVEKFGSKERLAKMGNKLHRLKFILQLFMCLISIFLIYSSANNDLSDPRILLVIIGLFIAALGNFFKTIQPNYFIGIRTPWTLKSETVWKKTHKDAGILWFIGGILMCIIPLVLPKETATAIVVGIVVVISLIPVIASYFHYKKEQETA